MFGGVHVYISQIPALFQRAPYRVMKHAYQPIRDIVLINMLLNTHQNNCGRDDWDDYSIVRDVKKRIKTV